MVILVKTPDNREVGIDTSRFIIAGPIVVDGVTVVGRSKVVLEGVEIVLGHGVREVVDMVNAARKGDTTSSLVLGG